MNIFKSYRYVIILFGTTNHAGDIVFDFLEPVNSRLGARHLNCCTYICHISTPLFFRKVLSGDIKDCFRAGAFQKPIQTTLVIVVTTVVGVSFLAICFIIQILRRVCGINLVPDCACPGSLEWNKCYATIASSNFVNVVDLEHVCKFDFHKNAPNLIYVYADLLERDLPRYEQQLHSKHHGRMFKILSVLTMAGFTL